MLPKIRDWGRELLRLFRRRYRVPLRPPVTNPVFSPADPVTALVIPETERGTALLSREAVIPAAFTPAKENDGKLLFPIDTYANCFRGVAASQATWSVVCAIDRNGECALQGERPGGDSVLILLTRPYRGR